jgi:hypothetical protein
VAYLASTLAASFGCQSDVSRAPKLSCSLSWSAVSTSRMEKMNAGPLNPDSAYFHNMSVICRACSAWLTPAADGALVGAPISVIQIFLPPSPLSTMSR